MIIIDKQLLDKVSAEAQKSDRLRKNYNFHQSLDEKCHRFLNAVEPGTKVEIHRHSTKDESFVLLRGKVCVNTYYSVLLDNMWIEVKVESDSYLAIGDKVNIIKASSNLFVVS